jgi:hypothetical protein
MSQLPSSGLGDYTIGALQQFNQLTVPLFKYLNTEPQRHNDTLSGQAIAILCV